MSTAAGSSADFAQLGREEQLSALFANLVLQQTEMALLLMGKVPHPETGKTIRELERARLLIDQLEMLEQKTRGNLSKAEAGLLGQSLMSLRMAFVETVDAPGAEPAAPGEPAPAAEAESPKRFTKKY